MTSHKRLATLSATARSFGGPRSKTGTLLYFASNSDINNTANQYWASDTKHHKVPATRAPASSGKEVTAIQTSAIANDAATRARQDDVIVAVVSATEIGSAITAMLVKKDVA